MLTDDVKTTVTKTVTTTTDVRTEVALDEAGGHVMLTLRCGEGRFCQALSTRDMGKILAVCDQYKDEVVCCGGDLTVGFENFDRQVVYFRWIDEQSSEKCEVLLETTDMFAFEWACRGYCRQLLRTNRGA